MWTEPADLLLVATSARALAESAVRGGFRVQILDGFCDQDTRALGPCTRAPLAALSAGLEPTGLRAALREFGTHGGDCGLVYGAGVESSLAALAALPAGLRLLGNDPAVLQRLQDPERLFGLFDTLGIVYPETRFMPPPAADPARWLLKRCGGSGGLGVAPWRTGDPRPAGPHYFQRFQEGDLMSVIFIADGRELELIGFSRLLLADADPRHPFLYGGAIGQAPLAALAAQTVTGWARSLVGALGLCGLNNLDFILCAGRPSLLELNPRPSATMGLYEAQCEGGWIRRHVRACLGLPAAAPAGTAASVHGQRVIYAPLELTIPTALPWPDWCRDRSAAGTLVPRYAPLCTVLAAGADAAAVESLLAARAAAILSLLQRFDPREAPKGYSP